MDEGECEGLGVGPGGCVDGWVSVLANSWLAGRVSVCVCDMREKKQGSWVTGYIYDSIRVFVGGYMCKCQSITIRDHKYSHTHCTAP